MYVYIKYKLEAYNKFKMSSNLRMNNIFSTIINPEWNEKLVNWIISPERDGEH